LNKTFSDRIFSATALWGRYRIAGRITTLLLLFILPAIPGAYAATTDTSVFRWGNATYVNLDIGETFIFNNTEVELLHTENHFNRIRVGSDTLWLEVSRRTLPVSTENVRIFVADNRAVKSLSHNHPVHGLLKKEALICLSENENPLLNPADYIFPVDFTDGYTWQAMEDSYLFSYLSPGNSPTGNVNPGIDLDMQDARGLRRHMILALENSRVVWIESKNTDLAETACVCLESQSNPGIYYIYDNLYVRHLLVRKDQKLERGDGIGYIWGDKNWGYLRLSVVKPDSPPVYANRFSHVVNFFPQLMELYYGQQLFFLKSFTKGRIEFGRTYSQGRNIQNLSAFEEYSGTGWKLGAWNPAARVEGVTDGLSGNARLRKTLFTGEPAACTNPVSWYDFEINVRNGLYRVRARVGDWQEATWQKVEFEGISAGTFDLKAGMPEWTSEKIVQITDGKLTVRIYVADHNRPAGLCELVFQNIP